MTVQCSNAIISTYREKRYKTYPSIARYPAEIGSRLENIMTSNHDNKSSFATLMEHFAALHDTTTTTTPDPRPEYANALTDIATAVTYSVLKKCIDPQLHNTNGKVSDSGYNTALVNIRRDIARARDTLDATRYSTDSATVLTYNDNGDLTKVIIDRHLNRASGALASATIGDGLDLVNTAVVAILDECAKQADRDPDMPTDLERPYTVRRLKRKVWIRSADSIGGWETVETSPIREVYRRVRRAIMSSRAVQLDPRNGYSYIADIATDPDSEATAAIYKRLAKYADLGGYATDFNGACTFYTVDKETADRYDDMVASLNLTKKQAQVLELKQRGYGNKAIATYLGVTENSVKGAVAEIRRKARKAGLNKRRDELQE